MGIKLFSGNWNVYRRKDDAAMWEQFELDCIRRGLSPSAGLAEVVRAYVNSRPYEITPVRPRT